MIEDDDPAVATLLRWRASPLDFAKENFKVTPDKWQEEALLDIAGPGIHRLALKACAGPGKSAFDAWALWWFIACHGDPATAAWPRIACLSKTKENLRDNLWAELHKWYSLSEFLKSQFEINQTQAFQIGHRSDWFISARSFAQDATVETMGESLSGLHSDFAMVVLDECGGMHPILLKRAEQAMATAKTGIIILSGNPTSRESCLFTAENDDRFTKISITGDPDDPKRSPRVNIDEARDSIRTYGRDNPWVQVFVLGQFPETSINGLNSEEEIRKAIKRTINEKEYNFAQKRIGMDVARSGVDRTVMAPRQGKMAFSMVVLRSQLGPAVGGRYLLGKHNWGSELDTIDETGGWAGAVIDFVTLAGHTIFGVNMAGAADDSKQFHNKRAEVSWRAALWVKAGGCLPDDEELIGEATAATYFINKQGKIQIEEKDQIKKRLGKSPDKWDAFCLTFAFPEAATATVDPWIQNLQQKTGGSVVSDVVDDANPLEERNASRATNVISGAPWEGKSGILG